MPERLRVGELRSLVRIESVGGTLSDTGGIIPGATTVIATNVPAAIDALPLGFQVREQQAAGGQQAALTHQIRMRYREDIHPTMRIVELHGMQRVFEIVVPPQPDAMRREIGILCVQRVS